MGASIFLLLFLLGILLSTIGGIIGLVEAFRVNTTWGLLSLLVPFALLVFFVKFFRVRQWTRNGFFLWLAGIVSALLSMLLAFPVLMGFIRSTANLDTTIEEVPIESIPQEEVPADAPTGEGVPGEAAPGEEPTDEEFAEPIVPAAPQLSAIARAELIQSTDPDERVQQINTSRPDPFVEVPVPPPPQPAPPPVAPGGGAGTPGGGGTPTTATAPAPQPPAPGGGQTTGQPGGGTPPGGGTTATAPGGGATSPSPIEPLPALPQPTLAQGVSVTGVVTIGNENYAIVQSPVDGSSQYVRAGQRLANDQVLVKRIEVQGGSPMVILEQNGIEVAQPVGSPMPEEGQEEQPSEEATAALSPLPPFL